MCNLLKPAFIVAWKSRISYEQMQSSYRILCEENLSKEVNEDPSPCGLMKLSDVSLIEVKLSSHY